MAKGTKGNSGSEKKSAPVKAKGTQAKAKPTRRTRQKGKSLPLRSLLTGNEGSRGSERVTNSQKKARSAKCSTSSSPSPVPKKRAKKSQTSNPSPLPSSSSSSSSSSPSPSPVPKKRAKKSHTSKSSSSSSSRTKVSRAKKAQTSSSSSSSRVNVLDKNKNDVLLELNQDRNAHKAEFEKELKVLVDNEKNKLELQSVGTKVGRCKGFFTQDRYNFTVEYLTLRKDLLSVDDGSNEAMHIKMKLAKNFKGKTMDQFRIGGEDFKKLYRLKKTVRTNQLGGIHSIKLSALDMDMFDEVIAIDDGKTFDRINDIHWCPTNPLNHIGSQQLLNKVQEKYGFNIPNNISLLVSKHCPVCKFANQHKNKGPSCGPLIFTVIDLSMCASKQKVKTTNSYQPYLLISLFTKKNYFDLIPLQTNENEEVICNLFRLFNAFGYPSSVRYFEHEDAPVQFILDERDQCISVTVDEFEKRLLEWIQCSQSSRDHIGVSPLTTARRRSQVLDKVVEFIIIFINKFIQKETNYPFSFQGWMPLIQSFLNENQIYTARKKTTFFASFNNAEELYNKWDDVMTKRFETFTGSKTVLEENKEENNNVMEGKETKDGEELSNDNSEQLNEDSSSEEAYLTNMKLAKNSEIIEVESEHGSSSEEGTNLTSTQKRRAMTKLMTKKTKEKFALLSKNSNVGANLTQYSDSSSEEDESQGFDLDDDLQNESIEKEESGSEDNDRQKETIDAEVSGSQIEESVSERSKEIPIDQEDSGSLGSIPEWSKPQGSIPALSKPELIVVEIIPETGKILKDSSEVSTELKDEEKSVMKEPVSVACEGPNGPHNEETSTPVSCNGDALDGNKDDSISVSKEIKNDASSKVPHVSMAKQVAVTDTSEECNQDSIPVSKESYNVEVSKDTVTKDTMAAMFSRQNEMNEGRSLVKDNDNVSKLVAIKKTFSNQCFAIAVIQFMNGMKELRNDLLIFSNKGDISVNNFIATKPFTLATFLMGAIMYESARLKNSEPVPFDTIVSCRRKHLSEFFSKDSQEDASEFMGLYLERLFDENPGGLVGRNLLLSSIVQKKCSKCHYTFPNKNEIDAYVNLCIQKEGWNQKTTSIQLLVNNSFENTINLEIGLECPGCKSKEVTITESRHMQNPPSDLILVVKRYQFGNKTSEKNPININCEKEITVSSWLDDAEVLSQEQVTYNLRAVVCHNGINYDKGHYRTLFVEDVAGKITYHELNDDKHYILSEKKFICTTESDGYIFHYSQRESGNLFENNYHDQIVLGPLQKDLEMNCKKHWRQKPVAREVRGKQRQSLNNFVIEDSTEKVDSTEYPINTLLEKNPALNKGTNECIGDTQQMCLRWDTTCLQCKKTFPTEVISKSICYVDESKVIGEKGLFAKRDITKDEYICRYVGNKVAKGTIGRYVVKVNNTLTIDALNHKDYVGRYANHSCEPNCILQKVSRDIIPETLLPYGKNEFHEECFIKAHTNIEKDSEITFHYGESFEFIEKCKCMSCSKT